MSPLGDVFEATVDPCPPNNRAHGMVVEIRYVEDHHVRVALRHGNSEQRRESP
jgi:hypothetical protein